MPIYEYQCLSCQHKFELIRPMSQADAPLSCQQCGASQVKRLLSVFYAESGGKAVAGMSEPSCASCSSSDCSHCGH